MDCTWHYDSPLGGMTLAGDGDALVGLWFDGQKYFGSILDDMHEQKWLSVFEDTCRWLDTYFGGTVPDFTPKLNMRGTPFRKAVWELLLAIPYGQMVTYAELASRLAKGSARSVGGAVGHNPISIIIPCHRVLGTGGRLTGYAGGTDRKLDLLRIEKISL